jgi:uncharacterized protein
LPLRGAADICGVIAASPYHRAALEAARTLELPDWWIGAGFVRNAVWDHLHGLAESTALSDIDVIWFDRAHADPAFDEALTTRLAAIRPQFPWSIKNQARMHTRNGDPPYRSSADAMCHWPETATAVAIALRPDGALKLFAPFGITDLLAMIVRPTPHFRRHRMSAFCARQRDKNWQATWPQLTYAER